MRRWSLLRNRDYVLLWSGQTLSDMFVTSHITERGAPKQVVEPAQVHDAVAQNEARYFGVSILGPP